MFVARSLNFCSALPDYPRNFKGVILNSICVVCGVEFTQPSNYQRQTCSEECYYILRYGKPKPEPRRAPETKSVRSSFTDDELILCRNILTSLVEIPVCKCENPERRVRVAPIGSEFKATCEWCGFEAVTVGGQWVGCETVKLDGKRRNVM